MEFNLIREEDADILEQGVEERREHHMADFDEETGRRFRVLEPSESFASLTELEENEEGGLASSSEGNPTLLPPSTLCISDVSTDYHLVE